MINPEFKAKWVAALRSGEYTQGTGNLYNPYSDSYCCLGVAGLLNGLSKEDMEFKSNPDTDYVYKKVCPGISYGEEMQELIRMNDGVGATKANFNEIADHIEKYL